MALEIMVSTSDHGLDSTVEHTVHVCRIHTHLAQAVCRW
jgi:hypothetical protein